MGSMTRKETAYVAGLPVTTWISLGTLVATVAAFGGKMYANDAVQSEKIKRLREESNHITTTLRQIQELQGQMWTKLVVIESDIKQAE